MSDWKKYRRANKYTARMREPYARATLFLTYIQGGNTTEWVDRLGEWLDYQIDPLNPRRTIETTEWVWNSVELVSRRPACGLYPRLTHKRRASYGHALGLSDWRLVI